MRLKKEVFCGDLVIGTEDEAIKIHLDVQTGIVRELECTNATLHEVASFISKAKTMYNKFIISKEADKFKF